LEPPPGLAAPESALDEMFSDPNLKALVIDVRIDFGDDDPYGLAMPSRQCAIVCRRANHREGMNIEN
jgi:hypothetical protein